MENASETGPEPLSGQDQEATKSKAGFLSLAVATCGVGYFPIAPGTWGSMVGILIYLGARYVDERGFALFVVAGWTMQQYDVILTATFVCGLIALALIGIRAATEVEKASTKKDPGKVVIDEVVGQLVTMAFIPFTESWKIILLGFLLFRLFDIWKPFPARQLESLGSGLGIVADDVVAGVYAGAMLTIILALTALFG